MARTNNLTNFLTDVAGAIKTKKGSQTSIPAANFDTEILALPSQGTYEDKSVNIVQNGNTVVTPSGNYDALSRVTITTAVPEKQLQTKSYNFTQNATLELTPDTGYDGFSKVNLTIDTPIQDLSDATATANTIVRGFTAYNGTGKVTGTFYGAKLFETQAALNADTPVADDTYAAVYGSTSTPCTSTSRFKVFTCPSTVTLPNAYTGNAYFSFRDDSFDYNGNVSISDSRFRFDLRNYDTDERYTIEYTSSDGITYTRTDSEPEVIKLSSEIYCEDSSEFVSETSYFIQILNYNYGGLYEKENYTDYLTHYNVMRTTALNNSSVTLELAETIDYTDIHTLIADAFDNIGITNVSGYGLKKVSNTHWVGCAINVGNNTVGQPVLAVSPGAPPQLYFGSSITYNNYNDNSPYAYGIDVDLSNNTCTITENPNVVKTVTRRYYSTNYTDAMFDISLTTLGTEIIMYNIYNSNYAVLYTTSGTAYYSTRIYTGPLGTLYRWAVAPTQFDATAEYVYDGKVFLGTNGSQTGTLSNTISSDFSDISAEIYAKALSYYDTLSPKVLVDNDTSIDKNIRCIPKKSDGTLLIDASQATSLNWVFNNCSKLKELPVLDISNATSLLRTFSGCTSLTTVPLLDTSSATNLNSIFSNCTSLTTVPLLNTSSATNTSNMFSGCTSLTTVPLLNTSNVTDVSNMLAGCTSLTTVPLLDLSSATNLVGLFNGCTSLTTVSSLNTSSATDARYMFKDCSSLTTIPQFNMSNVTTMEYMFSGCTSLITTPALTLGSVTSMRNLFENCTSLTTVTQFADTSTVTRMDNMFYGCTSLVTMPLIDTSGATAINSIFYGCTSLTTVALLDLSNVTGAQYMFKDCTSLTTVPVFDLSSILSIYGMFEGCTSLNDTSLNNIMQMCIGATSYFRTKTLAEIGLTSAQAARCQSLSNYSAFIAAGWTTGY